MADIPLDVPTNHKNIGIRRDAQRCVRDEICLKHNIQTGSNAEIRRHREKHLNRLSYRLHDVFSTLLGLIIQFAHNPHMENTHQIVTIGGNILIECV